VCHWLLACNLDKYTKEFMSKGVDGQQLLQLDGTKLKVGAQDDHCVLL